MKRNIILQTVPIMFSTACILLWLVAQTPYGFSYGTTAYISLINHIISPVYMVSINLKKIKRFWINDFKILIWMYAVDKIAMGIYFLQCYTFTSMDGMGWAIYKGVWIINSCILLIGWLIIKAVKSIQKH